MGPGTRSAAAIAVELGIEMVQEGQMRQLACSVENAVDQVEETALVLVNEFAASRKGYNFTCATLLYG